MRQMATKSAVLALTAMTLFFVGPQLGSIDIGGDGVADVPVMVMDCGSGNNVQGARLDRQARIARAIAPFSELTCNDSGLMVRRSPANLRTAGPESLRPLRW